MSLHWRQSLYYLRHQRSPTNILSKYPWLQFMETYNFIGTWWHLNPKPCIKLRHWCQYLVCMQSEVYKWLSSYHIFVMYPNTDCFKRNITENSLTSTNVKPHKIKLHFKVLPYRVLTSRTQDPWESCKIILQNNTITYPETIHME